MKQIKFLAISILSVMLIAFTGCNREEIEITPDPEIISPEGVTISATIDLDGTKVNYNDDGTTTKVYWNASGEKISMVYSSGTPTESILFTRDGADINTQQTTFSTTFTPLPAPIGNVYFIYPGSTNITTDQTSVSIDFSNQAGTEADASTRHLMVASNYATGLNSWSGVDINFEHKVAMMKIIFKNPAFVNKTISGITITGPGLKNKGTYSLTGDSWNTTSAGNTITINNSFTGDANGEFTVFFAIMAGTGTNTSAYKAYVAVSGNGTYTCDITNGLAPLSGKVYIKEFPTMTPLPERAYNSTYPPHRYVGAFWKADQTGERLIIHTVDVAGDVGIWKVTVDDHGTTGFVDGDIIFSTAPSIDPLVYTNVATDMNTYDADYQVTGGTSVSGNAAIIGDHIRFRIGLKQALGPPTSAPRYAKVKISYAGVAAGADTTYQETHYLYLRQGEEPDFVYRKTDNGSSRNLAVKWSPYNLTATQFNAGSTANEIPVGYKGGVFTNYPSQVGAFFRHTTNLAPQFFVAYTPAPVTITHVHDVLLSTNTWNNQEATTETCPTLNGKTYRRWNMGGTSTLIPYGSLYSLTSSELAQSLVTDPSIPLGNPHTNPTGDPINWPTAAGFYADGFFDRLQLTTTNGSSRIWWVHGDKSTKAATGYIYARPGTYAHIFLPLNGFRTQGSLPNLPRYAHYMSSGFYDANSPQAGLLYFDGPYFIASYYAAVSGGITFAYDITPLNLVYGGVRCVTD